MKVIELVALKLKSDYRDIVRMIEALEGGARFYRAVFCKIDSFCIVCCRRCRDKSSHFQFLCVYEYEFHFVVIVSFHMLEPILERIIMVGAVAYQCRSVINKLHCIIRG